MVHEGTQKLRRVAHLALATRNIRLDRWGWPLEYQWAIYG